MMLTLDGRLYVGVQEFHWRGVMVSDHAIRLVLIFEDGHQEEIIAYSFVVL